MSDARMSRRWLMGAGAAGTLGALLASSSVSADDPLTEGVEALRWDLAQILSGVLVAGGTNHGIFTVNPANFLLLSLTGSGRASPQSKRASGGGTFSLKNAAGVEPPQLGHGIFYVTGFSSFVPGGGSLAGTVSRDTIGNVRRTTGGVLTLDVQVVGADGLTAAGVAEIHCALPGGQPDTSGTRLLLKTTPQRQFELDTTQPSFTVYHRVDD